MFAIIQSGGKQYRVAEGDVLRLEALVAEAGDVVAGLVAVEFALDQRDPRELAVALGDDQVGPGQGAGGGRAPVLLQSQLGDSRKAALIRPRVVPPAPQKKSTARKAGAALERLGWFFRLIAQLPDSLPRPNLRIVA